MSVSPKNLVQGETREYRTVDQVAAEAVGSADQTEAEAGTTAVGKIAVDHEEVQIDPQLLAQATQNKNARLIAMMVHENAMFEVALEQERRARKDAEAKYEALLASLQD